ncbi:MAG: NAD(P)-dependent oxidoreductase [Novosphingobium sp. 16-62-11]|nr:MAG: NAD(P)-dependent oxidoreductase [Novosphingobium sp. 16-62-11]
MGNMLIFGMGYTSQVLAQRLRALGWTVRGTGSAGDIAFSDRAAVEAALSSATHVLSSVPPARDGSDPVLEAYGANIKEEWLEWIGYLSSTGVYGDARGAWVDETAPIGRGRRSARTQADMVWHAMSSRTRVFRLPGIYGPGRSALDRVAEGKAHRIDIAGQVFSRVHVEDIASGVIAGLEGPSGVYNLSDDLPCSQNAVIEEAARLLGVAPPPMQSLEEANLSPMALGFYAENRRVANGKAKRLLGWKPAFPTYREGLRALSASTRPSMASADPAMASADQR